MAPPPAKTRPCFLSYRAGPGEPGPEKSFNFSRRALAHRWQTGFDDMIEALGPGQPVGDGEARAGSEQVITTDRCGVMAATTGSASQFAPCVTVASALSASS